MLCLSTLCLPNLGDGRNRAFDAAGAHDGRKSTVPRRFRQHQNPGRPKHVAIVRQSMFQQRAKKHTTSCRRKFCLTSDTPAKIVAGRSFSISALGRLIRGAHGSITTPPGLGRQPGVPKFFEPLQIVISTEKNSNFFPAFQGNNIPAYLRIQAKLGSPGNLYSTGRSPAVGDKIAVFVDTPQLFFSGSHASCILIPARGDGPS